jgi:hypothetical protein
VFSIVSQIANRLGPLQDTFLNFGVAIFLAALIFLHYRKFGTALYSQQSFGPVLPFVGLTTFLVISTVKASFALSLGLVGALSIVRFRTPVKDPHELAYIFLAIAAGIGAAAGQLALALVGVPVILLIMMVMRRNMRHSSENVFLSVDVSGVTDVEAAFATVLSVVRTNAARSAFMRYEMNENILHVTAEAELAAPEAMARITSLIRQHYPATNVYFYDESTLPSP